MNTIGFNRILLYPDAGTGGGYSAPRRRLIYRVETNPEVKLIEGAKHKKVDLDSLLIQFYQSFNVLKNSDVDCFDYLHKYILNKIVDTHNQGNFMQLYLDTHPTLGAGSYRKKFDLPPLVGGDVKPIHRIADEITGMITMKERSYNGTFRSSQVIVNFLDYIKNTSVKEADHNFADNLIARNLDPELRHSDDDFARWSWALSQTFSRDGIYNALNKCSSENPDNVRYNAIETINQLAHAGVPYTLESNFVLSFLRNIEDLLLSKENLESWKVETFLSSFKKALERNPSLKENTELKEYFLKINEKVEPLMKQEEFSFCKYSYEELVRLITSTGAALLAAALF